MAKKLLSVTALLTGAILPACNLNIGNPPFDEPPDASPCPPPDAGNPPYWPDATLEWDAAWLPDAQLPGVAPNTPDAYPPHVDASPCYEGVPDAAIPDAGHGVPDAAFYPDAVPSLK